MCSDCKWNWKVYEGHNPDVAYIRDQNNNFNIASAYGGFSDPNAQVEHARVIVSAVNLVRSLPEEWLKEENIPILRAAVEQIKAAHNKGVPVPWM